MALYSFFYLRLARAQRRIDGRAQFHLPHADHGRIRPTRSGPGGRRSGCVLAQGWAGGTRIGECLAQFNREHAPRIVHSRTAVLVMSDGYDTGDPQQLSAALAQLRRRARRVVWLNPLSNRPGYAPICQGMQAALPHLDLLAPGADLASIQSVLPNLIEALG
jgi:uncharacterized protein with von Willebrand factor type A (vWA) domain